MKVAVFDADLYFRKYFKEANARYGHELTFFDERINQQTAPLSGNFPCICPFVNDKLDATTLEILRDRGLKLVALRSAGYNNVDLEAAERFGIRVTRVPAYSPHAVAEHAAALVLSLNRKTHKAFERVRHHYFSTEGLLGFDLVGKTIGVIGTGKIGVIFSQIMKGFGCEIIASDPHPDNSLVERGLLSYVSLPELYRRSDIISLHAPLLPSTRHLINRESIALMKPGVYLINTSRGALIDARALIGALKSKHIGAAGLDVYEEEEGVFFENLTAEGLQDDVLARLLTFPNVLVTAHQAFLTSEALIQIAETTLSNISDFEAGRPLVNEVRATTKRAA